MKLTFFICLVALLQVHASSLAQKVTLKKSNASLSSVLKDIGNQSGYSILYGVNFMKDARPVTLSVSNVSLDDALKACFVDQPFSYTINNKTILITPKAKAAEKKALKIIGLITDIKNQPLPGVSVKIKGTNSGVIASSDGRYVITVPDATNTVLVFSLIGYTTFETKVNYRKEINVSLSEKISQLESVMVVGYQTVNRKDFAGSASSLNSQQIKDVPSNSSLEALTGRLAGVQIVTTDGAPGAPAQIKIRGGMSISQDNAPLYIIDGVQVEDGLSQLSPQDIETIDVLKDASSTAIYGARGANGVVVITTKGGKEGQTVVAVNSFVGFKQISKTLGVLDPYDFVVYQYERSRRMFADSVSFRMRYGNDFLELERFKDAQAIDYQQLMFGRNAFSTTNNVSISGGTKTTQYNVSATQNKEEGIMQLNEFNRKIINAKFDHSANDKLRLSFTTRYNREVKEGAGTNTVGGSESQLRHTIKYRPMNTQPNQAVDEFDQAYFDDSNGGNGQGVVNPILLNQQTFREGYADVFNVGGNVNYKINKILSFRSTLGYNYNAQTRYSMDDSLTYNSRNNGSAKPILRTYNSNFTSFNNSNVLTFTNSGLRTPFHKANRFTLLLGQEINLQKGRSVELQLREFSNGITPEKAIGQQSLGKPFPNQGPTTRSNENNLFSLFSKIDYAYKGKYTANFSLRADQSSRFPKGRNVGYFPAGAISWKVTEEDFMKDLPVLNYLKLRASFGTAGNNRIADYLYLTNLGIGAFDAYGANNTTNTAFVPLELANNFLTWETTFSRNLGVEMGLFNDKISVTVDYYRNSGNNLLMRTSIPSTSGYSTQIQNSASLLNRGIETQIAATILKTKSFSWSTNFNISFNKNTIKKIAMYADNVLEQSGWGYTGENFDFQTKVGESVGAIYGFESDGFYTLDDFNYDNATKIYSLKPGIPNSGYFGVAQPGSIKLKDLDGDMNISLADRKVLGSTAPKLFGGLNQQFTYKNFDLSVFLNYSVGNKVLNASKIEFSNAYTFNVNILNIMKDRWKTVDGNGNLLQYVVTTPTATTVYGQSPAALAAANPNAKIWQPLRGTSAATAATSWAVEDASFLRINNITLGYSLNTDFLNKVGVKKLRFYVTGNNLAILTGYTGLDPEVNTQTARLTTPGVDFSSYPRSSTYLFGLNLTL